MSSPKKIKNPRLQRAKDAIEKINKIEELEREIIIESTKRKLNAIEKK